MMTSWDCNTQLIIPGLSFFLFYHQPVCFFHPGIPWATLADFQDPKAATIVGQDLDLNTGLPELEDAAGVLTNTWCMI